MSLQLYLPSVLLTALLAAPGAAQVKVGMSFWDQKESVNAVAFVDSGKTLVTAGGNLKTGHVAFWDLGKMTCSAAIADTGMGNALAMSAGGQTLATIGDDGTILLWDAVTGHARGVLGTNLNGFRTQLVVRPDGRGLVVGSYDGTIRLWTAP